MDQHAVCAIDGERPDVVLVARQDVQFEMVAAKFGELPSTEFSQFSTRCRAERERNGLGR